MDGAAQTQRASSSLLDRLSRLNERVEALRERLAQDVSYFAGVEPEAAGPKALNNNKLGAGIPPNGMIREANDRLSPLEDTLTRIEGLVQRLHQT